MQQFTTTYRITFTMTAIMLLVLFWPRAVAITARRRGRGRACPLRRFNRICLDLCTASSVGHQYAIYAKTLVGLAPKDFHPISNT